MALWNNIGELIHSMWEKTDSFTREDCNNLAKENNYVDISISGSTWKALITHNVIKEIEPGKFTLGSNNGKDPNSNKTTTTKRQYPIPTDDWIGKRFANNWEILRKISREEELEMGMGTHNAHFECINHDCGIITCIEKTTLNGYLKKPFGERLYNCRSCNPATCKYKDKVRKQVGRDSVTVDYSKIKKINVGETYGLFKVISITPSTEFSEHQSRAIIKCVMCGAEQEARYKHIRNHEVACDCFRNRSTGESIVDFLLSKHNIPHTSEYVFEDLFGEGGGLLRYDFAVLENNKVKALIEFDGQQHYQNAGSYYNPTGKVQVHDNLKDAYAAEHNIPLLRIPFNKAPQAEEIIIDFLKNI